MKFLIALISVLFLSSFTLYDNAQIYAPQQPIFRFSAFGDFGYHWSWQMDAVADLVKSGDTGMTVNGIECDTNYFVVFLGDNNYELGEATYIDYNIGEYSQFIYPYNLSGFAPGHSRVANIIGINRCFPAIGNHELYSDPRWAHYLYFAIPNVTKLNGGDGVRYYYFVKGNQLMKVAFFCYNSGTGDREYMRTEVDGVDSTSIQFQRMKQAVMNTQADIKIWYQHYPPFCSYCDVSSNRIFRFDFKKMGIDLVLVGHSHFYERLVRDSVTYVVSGLGGNPQIGGFGQPYSGSLVRYASDWGALFGECYSYGLDFKFVTINNQVIDNFTIRPRGSVRTPPVTLTLKAMLQGRYRKSTGLMIPDTVSVILRDASSPNTTIDSVRGVLNENGIGNFVFTKARNNTNYFIVLKHRNSLETWSAETEVFQNNQLEFDLITNKTHAYGNNLVIIGTNKYAVFSGDINQDGNINLSDVILIYNDIKEFVEGYVRTDLTGDDYVDATDMNMAYNNAKNFISVKKP